MNDVAAASGGALRSGQVAHEAGVNIQTLRYYERRGLLPEPERSPGGHRLYGGEAVTTLRIIKAAQRLGFTLDEVAELLEAGRHRHGRPVPGLQERAAAKLAEVDARIADLTTIRTALVTTVAAGSYSLAPPPHHRTRHHPWPPPDKAPPLAATAKAPPLVTTATTGGVSLRGTVWWAI